MVGAWRGEAHLLLPEPLGDRGSMVSADRYGDTLGASPGGRRGAMAGRWGRGDASCPPGGGGDVCCSRGGAAGRSGGGEVMAVLEGTGAGACWVGALTRRGRRASRAAVCAAALVAVD